MKLVRSTEPEAHTIDIQNWRRYGIYVPAGQVVVAETIGAPVTDGVAALIEQRGGVITDTEAS